MHHHLCVSPMCGPDRNRTYCVRRRLGYNQVQCHYCVRPMVQECRVSPSSEEAARGTTLPTLLRGDGAPLRSRCYSRALVETCLSRRVVKERDLQENHDGPLEPVARMEGFEPSLHAFGERCFPVSYIRLVFDLLLPFRSLTKFTSCGVRAYRRYSPTGPVSPHNAGSTAASRAATSAWLGTPR